MAGSDDRRGTWFRCILPIWDNIERAHRSGVKYIAQPGGSVRDDNVIETCNKYKWQWHLQEFVYSITKMWLKSV